VEVRVFSSAPLKNQGFIPVMTGDKAFFLPILLPHRTLSRLAISSYPLLK
jgi:hypothetical protein